MRYYIREIAFWSAVICAWVCFGWLCGEFINRSNHHGLCTYYDT